MHYCPYCGTPFEEGAAFCPRCGAPVAATNPAPQMPQNPNPAPQNYNPVPPAPNQYGAPVPPAPNQYGAPNYYYQPAPVDHYSGAKKLSTLALFLLGAAFVLDMIEMITLYINVDMPASIAQAIPSVIITALIAAIMPVFCKIAIATRSVSCAKIIKILSIVFLALQIISVLVALAVPLLYSFSLGKVNLYLSPLYLFFNRIPGCGLLRTLTDLITMRNISGPLNVVTGFISSALYVATTVMSLINGGKLGKS